MRVIFLGTPSFAVPALESLVENEHHVIAVFTQPDRPKGRGGMLNQSPVKEAALRLGLDIHQPERIRRPEVIAQLAGLRADAMVIVGYGQILPQAIIDLPRYGIINVHASLLPQYRGAAPIQWAIANGETVTGVTTMQIDAGLDTGGILMQTETAIGNEESALELADRLGVMGAGLLVQTLRQMEQGTLTAKPQDPSRASYAPILKKEDGLVDWSRPAQEIYNRSRGFLPWPGTYSYFRGQLLHIWESKPATHIRSGKFGSLFVQDRCLMVSCGGESALRLEEVQIEGRKRVSAGAFLNGQRLGENEILGEMNN
ncbi:MAG TPA: methionyl-tRNA formyltransferase [Bryobacteraceae bacterium]|nr:methionyl-tRNA formyltransferase [Bryobacteraceae bacterium]